MTQLSNLILSLFILNLGTAFGAGLYEARITLPQWFPKKQRNWHQIDKRAMHELDAGRKFWAFVTTIPLTILTIVNLIMAWQSQHPGHNWWLAAALLTFVERVATFTFFIPTIIKLQRVESIPTSKRHNVVTTWIRLNYVRNTITFVACFLALTALSQ
ncbi:hypothetical protein GCM10028806_31680 [Spirosoma terrae]|uniref:DUF1772 domain-containing protein n=1 Tax=Spirosoma terrae TaxID=1968276 RepID=A0A6L9L7Y8_9BACT|nr:anthrone oxygenase family protein [Spirosoma terrae]NDU95482.1 DUF1772 domain-containing protein [Spirosoma terrae]